VGSLPTHLKTIKENDMGRTKGSINGVRKQVEYGDYKYNVGDIVIYMGGLYEEYKGKSATIISRSKRRIYRYYDVEFESGKRMELKEEWIKINNIIDCEDVIDEN
jgi:hypothetical protein